MKNRFLLLSVLCLGLFFKGFAQSADEIVDKYVAATGGADRWAKLKTMRISGNLDLAPGMKAPFSIAMMDRNKMRFELEIQGMKMIQALDGDSGWKVMPFQGKTDPERMSEEEVRASKEQADYTGDLYDYKTKGSVVEMLGKEDMEGTETFKLKVTKKNGDVKYIYLDATSFLPLKETSKQKFNDKEVEMSTINSNFQTVDGITMPFTIEIRGGDDQSGGGQAMTYDKVEINPSIDAKLFAMPAMSSATAPAAGETK
jgi:hypothetical protein